MTQRFDDDAPNEILAAVKEAKAHAAAAAHSVRDTRSWPLAKIGLGVGIGSAAVAGAVLFANRNKDK